MGTAVPVSIGDLAQLVVNLIGGGKRIASNAKRFRPENSEVWHLECDNTRAREILRWHPVVSLEEGLRRTVDFIASSLNLYKPKIYNL
jgi:nucleoside-diphosphate-sugar epimerase